MKRHTHIWGKMGENGGKWGKKGEKVSVCTALMPSPLCALLPVCVCSLPVCTNALPSLCAFLFPLSVSLVCVSQHCARALPGVDGPHRSGHRARLCMVMADLDDIHPGVFYRDLHHTVRT